MKSLWFVAFVAVTALAACKQGKGDRCQVNSDCADGLVCKAATGTCDSVTETGIDAVLPADAPADAPPDAKVFLDAPAVLDSN